MSRKDYANYLEFIEAWRESATEADAGTLMSRYGVIAEDGFVVVDKDGVLVGTKMQIAG